MVTFLILLDNRDKIDRIHEYYLDLSKCQMVLIDRSPRETNVDSAEPSEDDAEDSQRIRELFADFERFDYCRAEEDASTAECYNLAMNYIQGDYVCFTDENVVYAKELPFAIEEIGQSFPSDAVFTLRYGKLKNWPEDLPVSFSESHREFFEEMNLPHIYLHRCVLRTTAAKSFRFMEGSRAETTIAYLMQIWFQYGSTVILDNVYCQGNKTINGKFSTADGADEKLYYIESLESLFLPLLRKCRENQMDVPIWMQRAVFLQLCFKYQANTNNKNRFLLNEEETNLFFEKTAETLEYIDDHVILDAEMYPEQDVSLSLRTLFAYLKHHGNTRELDRAFSIYNAKLYFSQCGIPLDISSYQKLTVMALNIRDRKLIIDLRMKTNMLYDYDTQAVFGKLNGERIEIVHTGYYALEKVFGVAIDKMFTFAVELPLEVLLAQDSCLAFYLSLNDRELILPLTFYRAPSKINIQCRHSYWMVDREHWLEYNDRKLWIKKVTTEEIAQREKRYLLEAEDYLLKLGEEKAKKRKSQKGKRKERFRAQLDVWQLKYIRWQYNHKKPVKPIWLYFDKLFKGGDNGEYAFRYAYYNDKTIDCYYVVNKDAPDYKRLKAEFGRNILTFKSLKAKVYALLADTVIATHPDIIEFFGYGTKMTRLVKDLFNPNLVCIAHGVTIQKNADYQNRLFDNTMFYTTSSKYEVEHILKPVYGYHEDEVALTGMARFDGLVNRDQRQILITPTWRRNLVGKSKRNTTRAYNNDFKNTDYYKIYNSLINDSRIIETAKKTGYRVIFLLHPSMSTQIDDYERNDYVELIPASGDMSYEKILTESSLMVTDYSGIHYDFGYMRKPVIYYQPKEIPMRFEEGGMKFSTMGFGPVCSEYEDAVRLICEYMENDCKMPEEYQRRADDFFAFDDYNSSKRIHEAVKDWIKRKGAEA